MAMTDAQALMAQGRREARKEMRAEMKEERKRGREEGRQEGQLIGLRQLLLSQLRFKFGVVSEEIATRVENLSEPQLLEVAQRILTASALEESGI